MRACAASTNPHAAKEPDRPHGLMPAPRPQSSDETDRGKPVGTLTGELGHHPRAAGEVGAPEKP
jgi:hypothetical protein